ncbi:hypothetical protein LBMAG25_19410 [Bacteroidota bacterium]|nr:hypothetical protein LBMAG25_19410 [Bacteroidota bacterium]
MKKKFKNLSPDEHIKQWYARFINSGLTLLRIENCYPDAELPNLDERLKALIDILSENYTPQTHTMTKGFILYDISNNKVRRKIMEYLERKGCIRIQLSVFFYSGPGYIFDEITQTLAEVNAVYENNDSIFIFPIDRDQVHQARVIGRQVNLEQLGKKPSVIFV